MSQLQEPLRVPGKKAAGKKPSIHPPSDNGEQDPPVPQQDKGDLFLDFWLHFGRFGWDIAGVGLIAFALITLIGVLGHNLGQDWAQGFFISPWVNAVSIGFGWGWPLAPMGIALLGIACLRRRFQSWPKISLHRVLALEGLAFSLLALLAVFGGWSLENAAAGLDGGVIGWGLARLVDIVLSAPWGPVFLVLLSLLFALYGFGLLSWTVRSLKDWLRVDEVEPELAAQAGAVDTGIPASDTNAAHPELPALPLMRDPNLPPLTLLLDENSVLPEEADISDTAGHIERALADFGVPAKVVGYRYGPTVTQYAVEPGYIEKPGPEGEIIRQKVRVSQISALSRDLALQLAAERLRIEAPVPGRSYVGIEVPNRLNSTVRLRPLLETDAFIKLTTPLALVFGRDVSGQPVVADLSRMPHMLIAGTTGSGKSVCISAIVTCLVMNNRPEDLRLALLDPKMVELVRFNGLPHLLGKVETQVDRMLGVLRWALAEMDHRYKLLEEARTRDIESYNRKAEKRNQPKLPRIVLLVDELADLMMTAPDQTEHSLIRLAQMARATGIHLVVATQRPSTDVVTGLIKANFPARMAFAVASSIDSRVILDTNGAEALLGKGDMLFLNPEAGTPQRAQGVLISDEEIDRVINHWREKVVEDPTAQPEAAPWEDLLAAENDEDGDRLVDQAVKIVRATQRASTSLLQRRLRIGYPRAARLMDELEELGVVGPSQGGGRERDVLLEPELDEEDTDRFERDSD
jgi:DNA segregation ATPase FtsK/SpoIIIE, S-DNA-T family